MAVFARSKTTGALTQLTDLAACVKVPGSNAPCTPGVGLDEAQAVTVSPDGKHVYVASSGGAGAVAAFARNQTTGALTQGPPACVSEAGAHCVDSVGLDGADAVTVSPDGKHVYATSSGSDAVAAFARNQTTGALTQLTGLDACVSETGTGGACTDGVGLAGARGVTVSPDGKHSTSRPSTATPWPPSPGTR